MAEVVGQINGYLRLVRKGRIGLTAQLKSKYRLGISGNAQDIHGQGRPRNVIRAGEGKVVLVQEGGRAVCRDLHNQRVLIADWSILIIRISQDMNGLGSELSQLRVGDERQ